LSVPYALHSGNGVRGVSTSGDTLFLDNGKSIIIPGISVANQLIVKDIEGNSYPYVFICNQAWTTKNLTVTRYRNGDIIPQVQDGTQWANLKTGAWCYYLNDPTTESTYGKIYNWYAVNDPRGLAPQGWHIPTENEWTILSNCVSNNGGALKSTSSLWLNPNVGASNSSGFSALPGGNRNNGCCFYSMGELAYFWSSTPYLTNYAINYSLRNTENTIGKGPVFVNEGKYVRCVKD
jgi:uncharacterized protein (TIGR02145 family)